MERIYRTIDGSATITSNVSLTSGDFFVAPSYWSFEKGSYFAKAMRGYRVFFEGLKPSDSPLDSDSDIAIWCQTWEGLLAVARYEPLPDVLKTLTRVNEWLSKMVDEAKKKHGLVAFGHHYAPIYIGAGKMVFILPNSYGLSALRAAQKTYEALEADTGIKVVETTPGRLAWQPIEGITQPTKKLVEEIFGNCDGGIINLFGSDVAFGEDGRGDWAECINIHIWHYPMYNYEILPMKQLILRAFRRKFGFVPIIRFTFGS